MRLCNHSPLRAGTTLEANTREIDSLRSATSHTQRSKLRKHVSAVKKLNTFPKDLFRTDTTSCRKTYVQNNPFKFSSCCGHSGQLSSDRACSAQQQTCHRLQSSVESYTSFRTVFGSLQSVLQHCTSTQLLETVAGAAGKQLFRPPKLMNK